MAGEAQFTQWRLEDSSAVAYESFLVPAIFRQGAHQLVEHAGVRAGNHVLDVGTGTGIVARTAAAAVGESRLVTGVDPIPDMLAVAQRMAASEGVEIDWREGIAEDLPFARSSFDAVLCQQGFQFFQDRSKALQEMHRVLVPEGRISLSVLRSTQYNATYKPLIEAFARHGSPDLGEMMQSPFQDWSRDDLRVMMLDAGFTSVSVTIALITARFPSVREFLYQELSSSPLSARVASMGEDVREAITRELQEALDGHIDDLGVVHPLQTYLVSARK